MDRLLVSGSAATIMAAVFALTFLVFGEIIAAVILAIVVVTVGTFTLGILLADRHDELVSAIRRRLK
ncbi:MAG: hypothetical protein ACRDQH_09805 [Pseudonocardiaceae bacterium]